MSLIKKGNITIAEVEKTVKLKNSVNVKLDTNKDSQSIKLPVVPDPILKNVKK